MFSASPLVADDVRRRLFESSRNRLLRVGAILILSFLPQRTLVAQTLPLPARPANAPTGTEFVKQIESLTLVEREEEVLKEILAGNVPDFLRKLSPITITQVDGAKTNTATFYVTPDYLAVGSEKDYFLTPLSPNTAQRIADALGCSLPTRKMVNEIYHAAPVKLSPTPIPPSPAMTTVPVFAQHNAMVRTQRLGHVREFSFGALVAGHKKDVVISAKLSSAPGKVAIYGWQQTNGVPIQPLYVGHMAAWVDYSHGIRLVHQRLLVNGAPRTVAELLADSNLASLLSDEGAFSDARYPTNTEVQPAPTNALAQPFTGFESSPHFKERVATFIMEPGVRVHINAPPESEFATDKRLLLVLYALPNGNTIEQTIGKQINPGDDWHFDIQHIGAQTRFLREMLNERGVVVAYLESNLKSWPAWRKAHGDQPIPEVVAAIKRIFPGREADIVLSSHSGGGSFVFGYLNTVAEIPNEITRIAFLDSNYGYERNAGHERKLAKWLSASNKHFLCVLAYNDAVALLNGKSFVSAAGGTWGKSHEMQRDVAESFRFSSVTNSGFERHNALNGQVQFILKENPERKIFHTVQVEKNGFIHSLLSGTPLESNGYEYFGERAYSRWIQAD